MSQFCGIQIYNLTSDAHISRLQVSKRSHKHIGYCQLFLLLCSAEKKNHLCVCFALDKISGGFAFSSLKKTQGSRYIKNKQTNNFSPSLPYSPQTKLLPKLYYSTYLFPQKEDWNREQWHYECSSHHGCAAENHVDASVANIIVKWTLSPFNSASVPPCAITQPEFLSFFLLSVWGFTGVPWGKSKNLVLLPVSENLSDSEHPWTVPSIYFPRIDIKEDSLFKCNPLHKSPKSHLTRPTWSSGLPWFRVLAEALQPGWGCASKSNQCCHL